MTLAALTEWPAAGRRMQPEPRPRGELARSEVGMLLTKETCHKCEGPGSKTKGLVPEKNDVDTRSDGFLAGTIHQGVLLFFLRFTS